MKNNQLAYLISFASGFLSLSLEILWMRIISFAAMSVPQAFSYTLALFLIGIAVGAHFGKKICCKFSTLGFDSIGYVFLAAAVIDLLLLCLTTFTASSDFFILISGVCVFLCASLRGVAFPLIHHVGTQHFKTGSQISNVYFSNVLGSSVAPLLISFIALDYLNTQQVYILICVLTFFVATFCFDTTKLKVCTGFFCLASLTLITLPERIFNELSKGRYQSDLYPTKIIENRYGFIQVFRDGTDQVVFGANVYDGRMNTNIFHNTNGIDRAYLLPVLKPNAQEILVIGLSTGSWVKVLSTMPNIKKITVIEINPAYIDLIKSDPIVSNILKDKRIEIIFDDGRKWIKKNSEKKYDVILMNTTWHWRAYISNLLSLDFLTILKQHMNPDSILFYNTTSSADAYYTASQVFSHVYQYKQMALISMQPVTVGDREQIENRLCVLRRRSTQQLVFDDRSECSKASDILLKFPLIPYKDIKFNEFSPYAPELITDDNMLTEFKHGKAFQ